MKTVFYFLVVLSFTGCMMSGTYRMSLVDVETPFNTKDLNRSTTIVSTTGVSQGTFTFEDSIMRIDWYPGTTSFNFVLKNKTDHSLKIIWDDAVYVDQYLFSQKVFHKNVKFMDRANSQTPSIILKGTSINESIIPIENISIGSNGQWLTLPLFSIAAETDQELKLITGKNLGKNVKILLPIKTGDTIHDYIFTFRITSFVQNPF